MGPIWFGGGVLAPSTAIPGGNVTNGFVGPKAEDTNRVTALASRGFSCDLHGYMPVFRTLHGLELFRATESINLGPGWNLVHVDTNVFRQTFLVFGATSLPSFEYDKNHLFEIHPKDLKDGFLIGGYVRSMVGGTLVREKFRRKIKDLALPSKGNEIHMGFDIVGKSGCERTIPITVTVSDKASIRGANINSYEQLDVLK